MIANTTYYLDHDVCLNYPTIMGWDEITLIERHLNRTSETHRDGVTTRIHHFDWVLRVRDVGDASFEYVTMSEDELFEELNQQYKLTPWSQSIDESDVAEPSGDGGLLNKGERRVLDALRLRTYKISADKLAAKVGLRRSTLYTYISTLRGKGFNIPENNGRYILVEQDNASVA